MFIAVNLLVLEKKITKRQKITKFCTNLIDGRIRNNNGLIIKIPSNQRQIFLELRL